jgi:hypothetical protein
MTAFLIDEMFPPAAAVLLRDKYAALAAVLDHWAEDHPSPYLGPHWPA